MDFHFYKGEDSTQKKSNLKKTLLAFLPLFILAGILPITLNLVRNPVTERFNSEAAANDLTIWFTPNRVITSPNKSVKLTVHAHFESQNLFPGITFPVEVTGSASIINPQINFIKPFNGEVVLGEITIQPIKQGELVISVDPSTVKSETFNETFQVITSSAKITVQ